MQVLKSGSSAAFFGSSVTNIGAESGSFSVPLGETLLTSINTFVTMFNSHLHTCSGPGGPSSPPAPNAQPLSPSSLSTKVKIV